MISVQESPCAEVRELVRLRLQELDERMQQMQRYRQELATLAEGRRGEAQGISAAD